MRQSINRGFAIFGAVLGWTALALQLVLLVRTIQGQGGTTLDGIVRYLGFFTIWTNILAATVLTRAALRPKDPHFVTSPRAEMAVVTAMVVVDIVYSLLLRQLYRPRGLDKLADIGLHDIAPVVFVFYWLTRPRGGLRASDTLFCLIYPMTYCLYALARGSVEKWYPYPFLDANALPPGRIALNCLGLAVLFFAVAVIFWVLDKGLGRLRAR